MHGRHYLATKNADFVPMKVVDLFCGTGGFSLGAHLAGLEVVRAIDIDPVLTSTFKSNFPNTNLTLGDISELSGSDLKRTVAEPIDALIGGPPCQPKFTMHFLQVIYVQGHTSPYKCLFWHYNGLRKDF